MARARTAVTTVMASSSETELKEKRRKAARTLLSKDWEYKTTVDEAARGPNRIGAHTTSGFRQNAGVIWSTESTSTNCRSTRASSCGLIRTQT